MLKGLRAHSQKYPAAKARRKEMPLLQSAIDTRGAPRFSQVDGIGRHQAQARQAVEWIGACI
jgi:hypothetical protein